MRSLKSGAVHLGPAGRHACQARIAAAEAGFLRVWPPGPTYYCRDPKCSGKDGGSRVFMAGVGESA